MKRKVYAFLNWLVTPPKLDASEVISDTCVLEERDIRENESNLKQLTAEDLTEESPVRILNHIGEIYRGGGIVSVRELHDKYPLSECAAEKLGFITRVGKFYRLSEHAKELCEKRRKRDIIY